MMLVINVEFNNIFWSTERKIIPLKKKDDFGRFNNPKVVYTLVILAIIEGILLDPQCPSSTPFSNIIVKAVLT